MIVTIVPPNSDPYTIKNVKIIKTKTNNDSTISLVLEISDLEELVIPPRQLLAIYTDTFWDENGNQLF